MGYSEMQQSCHVGWCLQWHNFLEKDWENCIIFCPYPFQFWDVNLRKKVQEAHIMLSRHGLWSTVSDTNSDEIISPCCERAVIKIWDILSAGTITHKVVRKWRVLLSRDGWIVNTKKGLRLFWVEAKDKSQKMAYLFNNAVHLGDKVSGKKKK